MLLILCIVTAQQRFSSGCALVIVLHSVLCPHDDNMASTWEMVTHPLYLSSDDQATPRSMSLALVEYWYVDYTNKELIL